MNEQIRRRVLTPVTETSPNFDNTEPKPSDFLLLTLQNQEQKKHSDDVKYLVTRHRLHWYWAPVFISFWLLLYVFVAIPSYHRLPKPLLISNESQHPGRFIAERAAINLWNLIKLGPRVVGSSANEKDAIEFFRNAVKELKTKTNDQYDIEADVQIASGSYIHWKMVNMYQGVQNFVIKLSHKDSNDSAYLLVNSHYDSVPGGLGAGDDGAMVAVMLETLRVLSQSDKRLKHPVLFLFNGAEENPLQASHAFITQHKWAKNVKALINLDSAGSGGREILFQSGPNNPWLVMHYRRAVIHPYASTVAEEMFQNHLIPSDTDFRIFRDHGRIPGLDMANQYNGYVYHTVYDRPEIIPLGSLQNTGDNLLALIQEIANSTELANPEEYSEGHTVYFDFMGMLLVFYSETEGIILNVLVASASVAACIVSFHMMATNSSIALRSILCDVVRLFGIQFAATILAACSCFTIAALMDVMHMPLSWFTHSWMIFGLYFCPLFFSFAIVPAIYFTRTRTNPLPIGHRVQMLLHCHCLFLSFVTLILTAFRIRSAFMLMIALLFYTMGLIINIATKLHNRPLLWLIPHITWSILPFVFYAYQAHGVFVGFIPMTGRFGVNVNPEFIIAAFTTIVGILASGFMIPVLNIFHKSKTIICSLLAITVIFIIIAATPLGFPYRPVTSVQRFSALHTRRIFHDASGDVRRLDTGYFLMPSDRRTYTVRERVINMTQAHHLNSDCVREMLCGLPLYNHRWHKSRHSSLWLPGPDPKFDQLPQLNLTSKRLISDTVISYELELKGPDHMGVFIKPLQEAKVISWSFHSTPLLLNWKPPYFIYFSYGKDASPLKFWLHIEKSPNLNVKEKLLEIGISGHWNHHDHLLTNDFKEFLNSFPEYAYVTAWPASYESWVL